VIKLSVLNANDFRNYPKELMKQNTRLEKLIGGLSVGNNILKQFNLEYGLYMSRIFA
jgi:hypothetical protein